jgi:hypothetical protein
MAISDVKNKSRHLRRCTEKNKKEILERDKLIEKLKKENEEKEKENKQKTEELLELEKDFLKFAKKQANSNKTVTNNTNNGTIDNRQYNMYYVINNYKEAHNIEDLLNSPLTEDEKQYILDNGSILGCYKLLQSRCIDDIEVDKRPFHCIDTSRCKYLLRRKNEWDVDQCGESILSYGCNKVKDAYDIDNFDDIEQYGKNIQQLLLLEKEGKPKILKELNKKSLLKNNIKNTHKVKSKSQL